MTARLPRMPMRLVAAALLLTLAVAPEPSHAQLIESGFPVRLTGRDLMRLVDTVGNRLREAAPALDAEGAAAAVAVADQLAAEMIGLSAEFEDRIGVPIQGFSSRLQFSAGRLYNAAVRLRAIADRRQQCQHPQDALFVSGIRTVAANLRMRVDDFQPDAAYPASFAFESLSTPLVVPAQGGRFSVRGHALWPDEPPELVLQSEDRSKILARLEPSRAQDGGSFSATLDRDVAEANAGTCLDLMIGVTVKHDVLFLYTTERRSELHVPMCLPAAPAARWMMSAAVGAEPVKEAPAGAVGAKTFYFENTSCGERRPVNAKLVWDGLAPEERLGTLSATPGDLTRGNSRIDIAVNGRNAVAATGWLDKAVCVNGASGPKLLYSTIYQMTVSPAAAGRRTAPEANSARAEAVAPALPETKLCAEIPRSAETARTDWWYSLRQLQASPTSAEAARPFYESPHLTATGTSVAAQAATVGGYAVDARFDPHAAGGKAKLCAVIKAPEQCRY